MTLVKDRTTGTTVVIFGIMNDVRFIGRTAEECARTLAAITDEEKLFEATDYLCGRFVILVARGDAVTVLTDATANRQVFYHRGTGTIASHEGLMRRNVETESSGLVALGRGAPGHHTNYHDVYRLTPNMVLDLPSCKLRRIWPRKAIEHRDTADAARDVAQMMRATLLNLMLHYRLRISVTAGLDSRTTAALCHDLRSVRFFNYYRGDHIDSDKLDSAFSDWYDTLTGNPILRIDLTSASDIPTEFQDVLSRNTFDSSLLRLGWWSYNNWRDQNDLIHIRSNLAEVGQNYYGKYTYDKYGTDFASTRTLAMLYLGPNKLHKTHDVMTTIDLFAEWTDATEFFEAGDKVDLGSLFYWESRLGSWYANVTTEQDVSVETISPYNCRKIFETMLSIPPEDRTASILQRRIIAENSPELTQYPLNGEPFWPDGPPVDLATLEVQTGETVA